MIRQEKQTLRARMKMILSAFESKQAASEAIRRALFSSKIWDQARVVYGFSPLVTEPDWLGPDLPTNKVLAFPRIEGEEIDFFCAERFQVGKFGIQEPEGTNLAPPPDLVLVPGVAFSPAGARLGRGGGFYDRWLARHPGVITVGVCFSCQIVEHLPGESHDLHVQAVLTEQGIRRAD